MVNLLLLLTILWRLLLLLEDAVAVDILENEDLTDMGLVSAELGNFLVKEAGDLVVSESPVKDKLLKYSFTFINIY